MHARRFILPAVAGILLLAGLAVAGQEQRGVTIIPKVAPGSLPITGEYWALIIGINTYKNVPPLDSAVKDAVGVRDVLVQRYGFRRDRIIELLNEQATRTNIEGSLFDLGRKAGAEDSVLIYYAGHGQYDEDGRLGWWVPVEGQPKQPGTFITNASIRDYIEGMKAKHVYLVADSCFSGTLFGKSRAMPPLDDQFFSRLYAKKSRWGLTSGGTEPVADQGKGGHSIFAYHFINLLKENRDPYLVPSHIFDQLAPIIANNADQMPRSEPMKGTGDEGGQFVLRLVSVPDGKPAAAQPAAATAATAPAGERRSSSEVAQLRRELEDLKKQVQESAQEDRAAPPSKEARVRPPDSPEGEAPPRQAGRPLEKLLEKARAAPEDSWPDQKKLMLKTMADKLREQAPNPSALRPTMAKVGRILEEARAMPPLRFDQQREQLLRRLTQVVKAGMRGEGDDVRR
ncbi:MAG: caspase family protein [Nitrospirales bacterium]|nr:caspase family protein [Nitrospirales bacterium]